MTPVELETDAAHRFQPTPELLESLEDPIDGLIVASPSNPTGTMLAPAELAVLAGYCQERGIRLISDEIYHGITYGMKAANGACRLGQRRGHQQLLEVLLDDRLAAGLDRGAPRIWSGQWNAWPRTSSSRRRHCRSTPRSLPSTAPTSWMQMWRATRPAGNCCWRRCRRPGSIVWRLRTGPSTSTPMSAI